MTPRQYGHAKVAALAEEAIGRGFQFAGHRMPATLAARIEFKAIADSPELLPYPFELTSLDGGVVLLADPVDVAALWAALTAHVIRCRSIQARFAGLINVCPDEQDEVDAIVWARA